MALSPIKVLNQPGIRRDGTLLEGGQWAAGQWVRFQRGRPRKIRGCTALTKSLNGPPRQVADSQTQSNQSYIHTGHQNGVDAFQITPIGVTSVVSRTPAGFSYNTKNTWQFATIFDPPSGTSQLIGVATTSGLDPTDSGTVGIYNGSVYLTTQLTAGATLPYNTATINAISAISKAASAVVTINSNAVANPFSNGQVVTFSNVLGMTQINGLSGTISATGGSTGAWTITVGINSTSFSTYTSGGQVGICITGVSGGICILNPYTILYGSNGYWAWSTPSAPLDFISTGSGQANITQQKILKGLPLRGGGGLSPAGLFWSVDSLVRATFVGGTQLWQWDTISAQISVLNANCIVEVDGTYYWAGDDGRFYVYNGVVRELQNSLNLNWFYDHINDSNDGKVFAIRNPRWGEIWWVYPRDNNTEPDAAVIYNYRENTWYDTQLLGTGRSAGILGDEGTLLISEPGDNGTGAKIAISTISRANPMVITTAAPHGLAAGTIFSVSGVGGMVEVNGQTYTAASVGASSLTVSVDSSTYGAYTGGGTVEQSLYTMWQHEVGVDISDGANTSAIDAYIETTPLTFLSGNPAGFESISAQFLETDMIQSGDMTVTFYGRTSANSPDVASAPYTISVAPANFYNQVVPVKEERRQMRLRFDSNVLGGDFQLGDNYLHVAPGSKRMTT